MEVTGGQPWLVNALAREVIYEMGVAPPEPITVAHIERAKERIILTRQTHLDSLVARLHEPRVRRIMAPIIEGGFVLGDTYDDVSYVRDLGLVGLENPLRVANPIYREVVVRVLSGSVQANINLGSEPFLGAAGRLDPERIFERFAAFWSEHGAVLADGMPYKEVGPQLVLMAWLQGIVNGHGQVHREYGAGRGRIDLLVRWPLDDGSEQHIAVELKVWRDKRRDPLGEGLQQLDRYLGPLGLERGWLVLFDLRSSAGETWERTAFEDAVTASGRGVRVLRA